jgi:hypothetical protein
MRIRIRSPIPWEARARLRLAAIPRSASSPGRWCCVDAGGCAFYNLSMQSGGFPDPIRASNFVLGLPDFVCCAPVVRLFEVHTLEATRSHRCLLLVGTRAPDVPPSTPPAAAPRPPPRMAPPAAPPAAPIAVFRARRRLALFLARRLRLFEDFVVLEVVAALATTTTPSARSPADIREARISFLITKAPPKFKMQDSTNGPICGLPESRSGSAPASRIIRRIF